MLRLSQRDIRQGYRGIKHLAKREVKRGNYEKAQEYIKHCAILAQQFNWIYSDFELEELLQTIGEKTLISPPEQYEANPNRVVFYDDFCTSFVLVIQYIKALLTAQKKILYLTPRVEGPRKFSTIVPILKELGDIEIVEIEGNSLQEKQKNVQTEVLKFKPSQVILHIFANSIIIPVLFCLPQKIDTYIINLADQTFWLGAKVVDYVIEFRQFGVSVSQQRRRIRSTQQLLIPFYPYTEEKEFQGFPVECEGENIITIFSGGDIYKVLDDKRVYWELVKQILTRFSNVVFIFATKNNTIGESFINKFIKENHFEGRFFYSSYRSDIKEVFSHADIYMGTCPASGSLMSQLAAINSKPILQFYYPGTPDDETEQAICYNGEFSISFDNINDFMEEAEKLVNDKDYRANQGSRLKQAMITESQFNQLVKSSLETNRTVISLKPYSVDYGCLNERWFALEKNGYINSLPYILGLLGKYRCLLFAPGVFFKKFYNRFMSSISQ